MKEADKNPFLTFAPPGHFYSPLPDGQDIEKRKDIIFQKKTYFPGIRLNIDRQLQLLDEFETYYKEQPFPEQKKDNLRYYYDNGWYVYCDGVVLYSMIRHLKPRVIIEIGSGFSSCNILDTNELFFNNTIDCTFIEPYPQRLYQNIKEEDKERAAIISKNLQEVPLDEFSRLKAGDILFIDSTHVAKVGSDVNYIFFEILPRLAQGVYVHFHDIFHSFEYPAGWYRDGRAWNESYVLRAFLQYNSAFEIVFFNSYLSTTFEEIFKNKMPLCLKNTGGSIWLKKTT